MSSNEPAEALQLTVYTGDSVRYGNKRLYRAVVELLHDERPTVSASHRASRSVRPLTGRGINVSLQRAFPLG